MPEESNDRPLKLILTRISQITDSHCGPAVVQMLLGHLGVEVNQEAVAEAGGATATIAENGMRIDQLARAVQKLNPNVEFWYKENATLDELIRLVTEYRYPAGVEWQGLFEADEDDEEDVDDGHYSIVTFADRETKQLVIVDPYQDYVTRDRVFTFKEFTRRWWDINEVLDPTTGRPKLVEDRHVMFVITSPGETFPHQLNMRKLDM